MSLARLPRLPRARRRALALGLAGLVLLCGASAQAEWIRFHFDAADLEFDPVFSRSGLVVSFSNVASVNAAGHVQFLGLPDGPPATPRSGAGHLRLTQDAPGGLPVTARLDFSEPVRELELYAYQLDCYRSGPLPRPSRCFNDALVEVFSTAGTPLAVLRTVQLVANDPGEPPPDASSYERLHFESQEPIGWLLLRGDTNRTAFDELAVVRFTPTLPSCGLGFELLLALPLLGAWRARRSRSWGQEGGAGSGSSA